MNGKHLKIARKKAKLTQRELAEKLGTTQNTVWRWECGRIDPDDETKLRIAKQLNISIDFLMSDEEFPDYYDDDSIISLSVNPNSEEGRNKLLDLLNMPEKERRELVMKAAAIEDAMEPIDVVKPRACAGNGNGYDKLAWTKRGTQYIDKNALLGHSWQGSAFKLIDIDGDSMQPRFNDGDRVLFVEGEPVASGDIVIAWWDSRLYIRGFIEDKNGITLKPMNAKYPEIHVDKEDERLYIAGKVIAEVPPLKMVGGFW